jgi:hypothetical protein
LTVKATSSLPGELLVKAKVRLGEAPMAPNALWWTLEIRQTNSLGQWENVLVRQYDHQAFHHDFKHTTEKTFTERLTMPAGRYLVFVGLRDDSRFDYGNGDVRTGQLCAGRSAIADVL